MSEIAIKVENISKAYRLGLEETKHDTLSGSMISFLKAPLNNFKKLRNLSNIKKDSIDEDVFWALKDINFEVKRGEAIGLIGKNGAGKSTLLKILSQITEPTTGQIDIYGRVASLLEVGTGFNPELTGRENVYLNGTILGMSKREIKLKFDEIIDFSGVEKFIDTPVKRYSSGMKVRLAFAVAAHLEPEILIVDEVLAVGDAEFQKKCLGKMQDVSNNDGRTVLFVSHNLQAVQNLCSKAILLKHGQILDIGSSSQVINNYLSKETKNLVSQSWNSPEEAPGNDMVRVKSIELVPEKAPNLPIDVRTPLRIRFAFWNFVNDIKLSLSLHFYSLSGDCIFDASSNVEICNKGLIEGECFIPGNFLNDGVYSISMLIVKDTFSTVYNHRDGLVFEVEDYRENTAYFGKWIGAVRPKLPFLLKKSEKVMHPLEKE
jgi:lipopolysaccharide transport system ATP-binding protein